jgi:N-acetylglucosamine-6-phosphate deacetylase
MSAELLLTGARVLTPAEELAGAWVAVRGSRIEAVGDGAPPAADETVDLSGRLLAPGFIDLHVHGGDGDHFMSGDPAACARAARFHARHGTTGLLATTLSAPPDELEAAVRAIGRAGDPLILGAHIEGPWLSERRRGAQEAEHLRPPDRGELAALLAAGPVRLVSLAPELPGALGVIEAIAAAGAVAALAHTDATYEQATAAIAAGARHAVHVFNGMRPLDHREPGVLGAVLDDAAVTCELIADGLHVHPATARLLQRAKGRDGTVLVTDAIEATGLQDGEYRLGHTPIRVAGGRAETPDGRLAGSTLTMDAAVRNAHAWFGLPLSETLAMATTTPARVIGLADRKGRIAPGYDADLVVLDDDLRPVATFVAGRRV